MVVVEGEKKKKWNTRVAKSFTAVAEALWPRGRCFERGSYTLALAHLFNTDRSYNVNVKIERVTMTTVIMIEWLLWRGKQMH